MNMTDQELERAILGLPLEEPPEGLRSSILLATAYRPAPALSVAELALLGSLAAVALWLISLVVLGGGSLFVHTLATIGSTLSRTLSNGTILAWLAAGGATALWLTVGGSQPLYVAAHRSERRSSR